VVFLNSIMAGCTTKHPSGHAHMAWENLKKIHRPKNEASKFEKIQAYNHCILDNDNKNPDEGFSQLETIRAELGIDFQHIITDEEIISHIIFNVKPQRYQTLMTVLKRELNNTPNTLDLEAVKKDIRQVYIQTRKGDTKRHNEFVLSAQEKKKMTFKKMLPMGC
jgi:hypothetical protein